MSPELLKHYCPCGKWGAFGYRVRLLNDLPGEWYCLEHRPHPAPKLSAEEIQMKVPERYIANCEICSNDLDTRLQDGSICQHTSGWVMQRPRGAHGIMQAKQENRWAHRYCVDHGTQTGLF
jgi:hypothetical protein